jgi:hypothetical protein
VTRSEVLSVHVLRTVQRLLATLIVAAIAVQFLLAGAGAFGAISFSAHTATQPRADHGGEGRTGRRHRHRGAEQVSLPVAAITPRPA